jgi:transcriptional regulator with GAF, ATPase, and Fis domain
MSVEVKETRQFTLLQNITQHIASGASTEDILRQVSRQLLAEFGYRAVQIYQLSTGGKEVWLYLELGHGNKPLSQTPDFFSIDEDNLISDAARRNELVYVPNLKEAAYAYYTAHPETLTGSEIAMPLRFGEELVGVLRIECLTPHGFTPTIFLFNRPGPSAGYGYQNNRKISQLEDSIQEIKTLYTIQHTATG